MSKGFDIIIGNPPYGNILTDLEKEICAHYKHATSVSDKELKGSNNASGIFIERSFYLLKEKGIFGMIAPNSIERIPQFEKLRKLLWEEVTTFHIMDEGFPFIGVNLEMATIFYLKVSQEDYEVICNSRKVNGEWSFTKKYSQQIGYLPLYNEELYTYVRGLDNVSFGDIEVTQGRPRKADYVSRGIRCISSKIIDPFLLKMEKDKHRIVSRTFNSIRNEQERTLLITPYFFGTDLESLKKDVLEVAIKPKGYITDGNGVLLEFSPDKERYIYYYQLLLNSRLANYIIKRYILNYSIRDITIRSSTLDQFPILYPENIEPFNRISQILTFISQLNYDDPEEDETERTYTDFDLKLFLEIGDCLIYELYLRNKILEDHEPDVRDTIPLINGAEFIGNINIDLNFEEWYALYWKNYEENSTDSEKERLEEITSENISKIQEIRNCIEDHPDELEKWSSVIKNHRWVKKILFEEDDFNGSPEE